jgi:hypothetical protein
VDGHPRDQVLRRNAPVDQRYSESKIRSGEDLARELDEMTGDRPFFIVARTGREKGALERRPFVRRVAEANS